MSFDVDEHGRAVVLDQVNQRLQIFEDGSVSGSVDLDADTYQDIALGPDGRTALLDRFGAAAATLLDEAGGVVSNVPLVGPGVPDAGSVTAIFQRDDGTWVEVDHQRVVRIADEQGEPAPERLSAGGRLTPDGSAALRASRSGGFGARLTRQVAGAAPALWAQAEFDLPLRHVKALESDASGRALLAVSLLEEAPDAPYDVIAESDVIVVFDAAGREHRRLVLPPAAGAEEIFRPVRFGRDGAVYRLELTPWGILLRRYVA